MQAIILSIGDELVLGQTVDTNSAWLSQQLAALGIEIGEHLTVSDAQEGIERAIRDASARCDFLIVSGGIGPTPDDLTRQALAAVMGAPLEMNEVWLSKLQSLFAGRGRAMPEINKIQAMIPRGARMIENTAGTAAGIDATLPRAAPTGSSGRVVIFGNELQGRPIGRILTKIGKVTEQQVVEALGVQKRQGGLTGEILVKLGYVSPQDIALALKIQAGNIPPAPRPPEPSEPSPQQKASRTDMEQMFGHAPPSAARGAAERHCRIFVMPGVPKEMKIMFARDVLPHLGKAGGGGAILSRTLHTFGLGESAVAERLGDLMRRDRNPSVGTTVAGGVVSLRINARFESAAEAHAQLEKSVAACRAALGPLIYGHDEQTLPDVLARMLIESPDKLDVATAESGTGGLLSAMLTEHPRAQDYFARGWIAYSADALPELLEVTPELVRTSGPVSEPVALAMARSARQRARSDYGLAIAGPEPAAGADKAGEVCIALDHAAGSSARTFNLFGDRQTARDRAAKMALTVLRFHLLGAPLPF